jgi:F-box protein 21
MRLKGFSHYVHGNLPHRYNRIKLILSFTQPTEQQESWKILDKFPHTYLTTSRSTIPISLVHVFVAIATRLDIDAHPVNFPRVVLSYVRPREQTGEHVIVNPSALDPSNSVIEADTPYNDNPIQQVQTFAIQFLSINPVPCDAATMLIRACRNIAVAIPRHHAARPEVHAAVLLPLCVNLIFQAENNTLQELFETADLQPLDCIFLLDELAPYLAPRCKRILEGVCRSIVASDAQAAEKEFRRKPGTIQFFVGMAFVHTQYEYTGFIFSWDVGPYETLHFFSFIYFC